MTQSVTFHFTSPEFVFESGFVVFTKGARLFSDDEFRVGEIRDGSIDDVLVEGPIEFDATLGNLSVIRREDRRRYHVALLKVTGDLHPEDLRAGRVTVFLHRLAMVIVRVEDSAGHPVSNVSVSLTLPDLEGSIEAATDNRGEVVLLGGVGRYSASVGVVQNRRLRPKVSADLEITPDDIGERTVVLRV